MAQLRAYGLAGVASYGLWNTIYYLLAFSAAWMAMSGSVQGQVRGEAKGTRGAAARHTLAALLLLCVPVDPSPSLAPDVDPTSAPALATHSRGTGPLTVNVASTNRASKWFCARWPKYLQ